MITNFKQVSPRVLESILENPDLTASVLEMDLQIIDVSFGRLAVSTRLKKQLDRLSDDEREILFKRNAGRINQAIKHQHRGRGSAAKQVKPSASEVKSKQEDSTLELSIDRAYHLHSLLCPEQWGPSSRFSPLCKAIEGGSQIGGDLGCGPAHFLAPDEVRRIAIALSDVSEDDLRLRLDLGEDYEDATSGDLASALKALAALREYYVDAASRGNAILIHCSWFLLE